MGGLPILERAKQKFKSGGHMKKTLSILLLLSSQITLASIGPLPPQEVAKKNLEAARKRFEAPRGRTRNKEVSVQASQPVPGAFVKNGHLIFDDRASATAWLRLRAPEIKKSFGAVNFTVADNHAYQTTVQAWVDELWVGFKKLFPAQTEGLESPPVLMVESEISNAFVENHDRSTVAHAVIVLTALIDEAGGIEKKTELTGILAHEIAHAVFKHGSQDVKEKIEKFYVREGGTLGFESKKDDPKLQGKMRRYLDAARSSGELTDRGLLNLPSPGYASPYLYRVWNRMRSTLSENSNACNVEKAAMKSWGDLLQFSTLEFGYLVKASPEQLRGASQDLIDAETSCFRGRRASLKRAMAAELKLSEEQLEASPEFSRLLSAYSSGKDSVEGLTRVVELERKTMLEVEASVDFSHLGYYTTEQHADDVSALVHASLGQPADAFGRLLKIMMANIRAEDAPACEAILGEGQTPAMGSLFVVHHSYCYRIYNFREIAKRLTVDRLDAFVPLVGLDVRTNLEAQAR